MLDPEPRRVSFASDTFVADVPQTYAIDSSGVLFRWGANSTYSVPVSLSGTWKAVATHTSLSCGIAADGTLLCWGGGYGSTPVSLVPKFFCGANMAFDQVGVGSAHACGITTTGELYCWVRWGPGRICQMMPSCTLSFLVDRCPTVHLAAGRPHVQAAGPRRRNSFHRVCHPREVPGDGLGHPVGGDPALVRTQGGWAALLLGQRSQLQAGEQQHGGRFHASQRHLVIGERHAPLHRVGGVAA